MDKHKFRVGLVGAGQISEFHVRALGRVPSVEVVGICDMDTQRAADVASRHGIPNVVSSLDALIDLGLDVVHVLTPPATHASLALHALERGCHVYVEKPLATRVEDCDRLAQASQAHGRQIGVGHSLLEDPFIRRGTEMVRAGAIGTVVSIDHYRCQAPPPYAGGRLPDYYDHGGFPFRDLGVHGLYVIEHFLGPVAAATPQIASSGEDPNFVCDEWRVTLRTARGSAGMYLSWRARPQQNVFLLHGTRGLMRIDLVGMTVTVRRTRPLPEHANRALNTLVDSAQSAWQSATNVFRILTGRLRQYHGLQEAVVAFYERLEQGREPAVDPLAARSTVYWTEEIARFGDEWKRRACADRELPRREGVTTLVTGATGFLGRHLVDALRARGERVRVFIRSAAPAEWQNDPGIEVMFGDLGDPAAVDEAVRGIVRIFHLGAAMRGSAADFDRGTVAGTRNVVDAAVRHRVGLMIYMSSLGVLHNAALGGSVISESSPLEPRASERGHYTGTKLQAETIVREAMAGRGLNAIILRPAEIVESGRPLLTASIAQRIGGTLLVFGNGAIPVPTVDVRDVVAALLSAAEKPGLAGQTFHLVEDASPSQNELITRYKDVTREKLRVVRIPKPVLYGGAMVAQLLGRIMGRQAPLSAYRLDSALVVRRFDCSAAKRALDWKPGGSSGGDSRNEVGKSETVGVS